MGLLVSIPASPPQVCSTRYELVSPRPCSPLDWACGYTAPDGPPRGHFPEGACATAGAMCTCDTAGAAACSAGAVGTCSCRMFPSSGPPAARTSSPADARTSPLV
jgi:hypothetical protein